MNTIHNNGENDKPLNEDLEKLSQVYGKLEQDEPPDLLDQTILNSAHRALEKKPGWMQIGWLHGLATAAVFVLAFTIILDQRESAPVFQEDILRNSPARMEDERELKKQSFDNTRKSNIEMEASADSEQKPMMETVPALAAPANQTMELSSEEQNERSIRRAQSDLGVQHKALGKSEHADKDDMTSGYLQEDLLMDEADAMTESPAVDSASIQVTPAAVAEPVSNAVKARGRMDAVIEQELQTIIELQKSGDGSWIAALEAFVERYPDYPLPDGLKD